MPSQLHRSARLKEVNRLWKLWKLPNDFFEDSFLDVACYAGGFCVFAKKMGCKNILGINDFQAQELLTDKFLCCDVFSERFLTLPQFDIVLCAGLLYHVKDPIELIYRLKLKVRKKLILETNITRAIDQNIPLMQFLPKDELCHDFSNWWNPNIKCVQSILQVCGFSNIEKVHEEKSRVCFHAIPINTFNIKTLPAKKYFI